MQPRANMKPRPALVQSAPSASRLAMSNALTTLPAAPIRMSSRNPGSDERVVDEEQALAQWYSDMIGEFQRRGPSAPLGAVHHNEVGTNARLPHSLDDGHEFPRVAKAQLEADRLPAREGPQLR